MNWKMFLTVTVAAVAGNYLTNQFVLRTQQTPNGFIAATGGAQDDLVRGATIATSLLVVKRFF